MEIGRVGISVVELEEGQVEIGFLVTVAVMKLRCCGGGFSWIVYVLGFVW
jgi:hypothetical protein